MPLSPASPGGPWGPSAPSIPLMPGGPGGPGGPASPLGPSFPLFPSCPFLPLVPGGPGGPWIPARPCGPCCPGWPSMPLGPGSSSTWSMCVWSKFSSASSFATASDIPATRFRTRTYSGRSILRPPPASRCRTLFARASERWMRAWSLSRYCCFVASTFVSQILRSSASLSSTLLRSAFKRSCMSSSVYTLFGQPPGPCAQGFTMCWCGVSGFGNTILAFTCTGFTEWPGPTTFGRVN
mmetsp:Transcript_18887/g.38458  ORF Transcript_18887/g.38458 Transcript_18887/m.38458 type:complete len:238 (+) Transcript_18887:988-1701(+)